MAKIKILSENLVNKIAAGEVVERPASVVKELLDNAYDSGASNIIVDIEDGGIKKIRIVDNGEGMDKEDVENAFKPHATSKIAVEEDLLNIKDYGFRGEALSSIASVSKVTLKSRQKGANLGTEIRLEGGTQTALTETGSQIGTSILIEDLFYNIPARKEFLKPAQSEYRAILKIFEAYAIANPTVGISLTNNGKEIYNMHNNEKIEDRTREVMGSDFAEKLIPIFFEHPHLEIYGFAGRPEQATERKKNQYIFVNKRTIDNRQISFAVKQAYKSLIPNNTYPPFLIFIDIPSNSVDVNVHPRKIEVRFTDDRLIFSSVKNAVEKALSRTDLTPKFDKPSFASNPYAVKPQFKNPMAGGYRGSMGMTGGFGNIGKSQKYDKNPNTSRPKIPIAPSPLAESKKNGKVMPAIKPQPFSQPGFEKRRPSATYDPFEDPFGLPPVNTFAQSEPSGSKKVLQIHNLYLVTQSESGILVYDQHAVHERIIYEQLINAHKEGKQEGSTQPLLTPVIINLATRESEIFTEYKTSLEKAGFKIEEFGKNSYKITEIPAVVTQVDLKTLIHELLEDLENDDKLKDVDSKSNKMLTYLACRSAYKAGDLLPPEEAVALIEEIENTDIKYTCPHGRPVRIEITLKELSKMFKRTK